MMRKLRRNSLLIHICLSLLPLVSVVALAQVPFVNLPLVPDAKAPGGTDFTLTVNGTGFVSGSVVNWNGSPRATTFVSASKLKAAIPAADIAANGTATVTVVNPAPGGGTSNVAFFSVAANIGHSGAFVPGSSPATGDCPSSVAVGDFNGDGILDLAVANDCSNTISMLLGDGTGNFVLASSTPVGSVPASIGVGDFNGDGKLDLVVADSDGTVFILLGDGTGNFTAASSTSVGSYLLSLAVGDFNGDGNLDLVVVNGCHNSLFVLLGDGAGNLTLASSVTANCPMSLAVGDFNGDGKLDLAVTNAGDNTVSILLGDGTGRFTLQSSIGVGSWPSSVAAADFNQDGKLDLAVTNYGSQPAGNTVSILLGDGKGNFTLASSPAPGINPSPVVLGDFNADGKLDLAIADVTWDSMYQAITTLIGDGKGNFSLTSSSPVSFDNWFGNTIAVGDFNGDGKLDIAVADRINNRISILMNNGRQKQTTTTLVSTSNPSAFWQAVTLTAAVSSGSDKPTGLLVFWEGSAMLGTATLTDGSASIALQLTAGSHSITAEYQGSVEYSASVSTAFNQVVNRATTTTSLVSSLNPVFVNQTVTYSVTVSGQYGGSVTGNVAFQDGGVTVATVALSWNQQTSFSTSYTAAGAHQITASYLGDSNNSASTSKVLVETIWQPTITSKTVVVTSGSPSFVGQPVTFTATVTSTHSSIPDGELVTFFDGWTQLASVALTGGTAAYTTASLAAKTHYIKAEYQGDATFKPSSGTVKQVVLKYATTTTLTSSPNPSTYGQPVTFTATVTPSGTYAPTGKIWFKDGSSGIRTVLLNGGVATLTTSKLAVGNHSITAEYLGDSYNAKSTSPAVEQVVQ